MGPPTDVLLFKSDAPAVDRLRALRRAAVIDGLDAETWSRPRVTCQVVL